MSLGFGAAPLPVGLVRLKELWIKRRRPRRGAIYGRCFFFLEFVGVSEEVENNWREYRLAYRTFKDLRASVGQQGPCPSITCGPNTTNNEPRVRRPR